jgi:V8-like Glu-specific endopeptidase
MRQNLALAVLAGIACAFVSGAVAQTAPDLSAYDCSRVGDGITPLDSRHVLQVIDGQLTEWDEHLSRDAPPRLVCIEQTRPVVRQRDVAGARDLLAAGATADVTTVERSQATPPAGDGKYRDAPPMPLPRAVPPTIMERPQSFDAGALDSVSRRLDGASAAPPAAPPINVPTASAIFERAQTVGVDDRTRVSTITSSTFPYATVGFLVVTYPSGNRFRCSGVVVSAYVVLTAGHCVHNNNEGGFISSATFYPAQNETSFTAPTLRPFGGKSDLKWVRTTQRWSQISGPDTHPTTDYQYDLGVLQFATAFTYTATFMPLVFNDTSGLAYTAGYPSSVGGGSNSEGMWEMNGAETATSTAALRRIGVREYAIDASGGQSGSPFWDFDSSTARRQLMGILSYGEDLGDIAGGPWYSTSNQTLVSSWIAWTPASDAAAAGSNSVSGLRVPAIFDSSQPSTQSFLRFFNTGVSAATVDVTLASYDDGQLLATWTSPPIPANGSLQFDIATIEAGATGGALVRRGYYAASVRAHFNGYFQHVLWRRTDGTLTNATACDTKVTSDPTKLMNVHSSLLSAGYPATIVVHNTGTAAVTVSLGVYDARTGTKIGSYSTGSIPANGEVIRTVSDIERSFGFTPSGNQYHYNIRTESTFTGTLQSLMTNTASGVVTDMTDVCVLVAS